MRVHTNKDTLALVTLLAFVFAVASTPANPAGADPVKELAAINMYAFGGVGFAGTISRGETLHDTILEGEGAEAKFVAVYEGGTPEARAYALSGLHKLKSGKYEELKKGFLKDAPTVNNMVGCVVGKATAAEAVARYEKRREAGKAEKGGPAAF